MSSLLIKNGFLLTMNDHDGRFYGDVLIQDDRIDQIAPKIEQADG